MSLCPPPLPGPCPSLGGLAEGEGTTVVILDAEGTRALLGKCRCAPASVLPWFQDPRHRQPERFGQLWSDFIVPRMRGCLDRCRDIESTYSDTGYRFRLPAPPLPCDPARLCDALVRAAEQGIRQEGTGDAFLEPCGDTRILVDLRGTGAIFLFHAVHG